MGMGGECCWEPHLGRVSNSATSYGFLNRYLEGLILLAEKDMWLSDWLLQSLLGVQGA